MATTEVARIRRGPSRADVLAAAIARELERHRDDLEADDDLRAVTVQVRLNRATGLPRAVILTRESEREYTRDA